MLSLWKLEARQVGEFSGILARNGLGVCQAEFGWKPSKSWALYQQKKRIYRANKVVLRKKPKFAPDTITVTGLLVIAQETWESLISKDGKLNQLKTWISSTRCGSHECRFHPEDATNKKHMLL